MTNNNYSNSSIFHGRLNNPESFEHNGLPPQNVAAEEAVLGGILLDPDALNCVINDLSSEAFYITSHQLIYSAFLELHKQGKPTDIRTVASFLQDNQLLEKTGGHSKLVQLVEGTVSAINIQNMAALVVEKYKRRQLIYLSNELHKLGHANHIPLPELLKEAEAKTHAIAAYRKEGNYQQAQAEVELMQLTRELEEVEAIDNPLKKTLAIKNLVKQYGFRSVNDFKNTHAQWLDSVNKSRSYSMDEYLNLHGSQSTHWLLEGWIPGKSITVVHSLGGVGKTTLVNTLCQRLITGQPWGGYEVRKDKPVKILWIQTDQGPNVTLTLLDRQGFFALSPTVKERQRILDRWNIESYAVLERELEEHKYDLVVIDSLTSVSSELCYKENDQEFARPFARLRHIANKHDCAFLVLHHSSKGGGMRGTSAIKNAADQVWDLQRVVHATDTIANLTIEKSRYREDRKTYRLEFDQDDHFWVSIGEVTGEGANETVHDVTNPTLKTIRDFLRSNEGIGFQGEEISNEFQLNRDYCRKILRSACQEGLINSRKGTGKALIYFVGQLKSCDKSTAKRRRLSDDGGAGLVMLGTFDIPLPDPMRSSRSSSDPQHEDRMQSHGTTDFEPSKASSDPSDPQNLINVEDQITKSEDREDRMSCEEVQSHSTSSFASDPQHEDREDREDRIEDRDPREITPEPDCQFKVCAFKVGDRVVDEDFPHVLGEVIEIKTPKDTERRLVVRWEDGSNSERPEWIFKHAADVQEKPVEVKKRAAHMEFNDLPGKIFSLPALAKKLRIDAKLLASWAKKDFDKFVRITQKVDPTGMGWWKSPEGKFFKQVVQL